MKKINLCFNRMLVILSCIGLSTLSGCSREDEINWEPDAVKEFSGVAVTDAEEGIYFIEEVGEETADGNVLENVKYFDSEEKASVPLCSKANCKHDSMECPAVQLGEYEGRKLGMLTPYKNALYLYYMSDGTTNFQDVIMKADSDGNNRRVAYTLPQGALLNQAILYQDTLFLSCNMMGEIDDLQGGITETSLYVYDLNEEKEKRIASTSNDQDGYFYYLGCQDGKAYYIDDVYTKKEKPIYTYTISSGEISCINSENTISTSMMYKGKLYGANEKSNDLFSYDVKTKEKVKLATFTPFEEKAHFNIMSSDGLLRLSYLTHPGTRQSKVHYQIYDTEKEKFLYPEYKIGIDLYQHYQDGYIGSKDNETGYFDKWLKFYQLE